jgi:hypothetical protein
MIKKISSVLAALVAATSSAFATQVFSISCSYPSNPSGSYTTNQFFIAGTIFTATMSGVGSGGGVAYAINPSTGVFLAFVNTGAGPGQSFYGTNTSSALTTGMTVGIDLNLSLGSTGAYGTSSVTTNW